MSDRQPVNANPDSDLFSCLCEHSLSLGKISSSRQNFVIDIVLVAALFIGYILPGNSVTVLLNTFNGRLLRRQTVGLPDLRIIEPSDYRYRSSCTIIGAAHRFSLPDFASSHWVHSLCLDFFVCQSYMCMHVVLL